jgi:hypothetical protein
MTRDPNRWTQRMKARGRTQDAVAMFVFYIGGTLLTILSVFGAIAGLLFVTGDLGSGGWGRALGIVVIALSASVFALGVWLTRSYRVQERKK